MQIIKRINSTQGEFKCPVCSSSVIKSIRNGLKSKTCGTPACRKAALTYNPNSAKANLKDNPLYKRPYVRALQAAYKNLSDICSSNTFTSFEDFYDTMIDTYSDLRITSNKINISIPKGSVLSKETVKMTKVSNIRHTIIKEYYTNNPDVKDSLRLATEFNLSHSQAIRAIKPIVDKNTVPILINKYKYEVIPLNELDYEKCKAVFTFRQSKIRSNIIYLMESDGYYKIGITTDIKKRLRALNASSPLEVSLIYSKETKDAPKIEKFLHNIFHAKNHKFEWFALTADDIELAINYIDNNVFTNSSSLPMQSSKVTRRAKQPKKEVVTVTSSTIPEKFKKESKTKHPMYIAHRTLINNKQKGYKVSDRLDDFDVFKGAYEAIYNTLNKPTLVTKDKHYSLQNTTFKEACDVSNNTRIIAIIKGNDTVGIYNSIKEAADAIGGTPAHISACCSGKRKSHKGFTFKYIDSK